SRSNSIKSFLLFLKVGGIRLKRARIIYNPTSGKELIKKELPTVLERFEIAGYETSAHATTREGDAIEAAKTAVQREFEIVVVAWGDCTSIEVIQGIAEQEHRPKLVIIPSGTTYDFARSLSNPRHIQQAVDVILADHS